MVSGAERCEMDGDETCENVVEETSALQVERDTLSRHRRRSSHGGGHGGHGANSEGQCHAPHEAFHLTSKGCPNTKTDSSTCMNKNKGYSSFSHAWSECGKTNECKYISRWTNGKYYLRRATDPDDHHHGAAAMKYSCHAQVCCLAMTAECLSCAAGQTVEEYCKANPKTAGCPAPGYPYPYPTTTTKPAYPYPYPTTTTYTTTTSTTTTTTTTTTTKYEYPYPYPHPTTTTTPKRQYYR